MDEKRNQYDIYVMKTMKNDTKSDNLCNIKKSPQLRAFLYVDAWPVHLYES